MRPDSLAYATKNNKEVMFQTRRKVRTDPSFPSDLHKCSVACVYLNYTPMNSHIIHTHTCKKLKTTPELGCSDILFII